MKYYYTYIVICTKGRLKGHIYFGQHITTNLEDNYKGSGKLLRDYYKKYPNDYIKIILQFYNNQDDLNKAEYNLIHPHLNKSYCLNQRDGGWKPSLGDAQKQKLRDKAKKQFEDPINRKRAGEKNIGRPAWNKGKKGCFKEETIKKFSDAHKGKSSWNKGISPTDETRRKISNTLKDRKLPKETCEKMSKSRKGHECYIKGQHRVYENPEHTKWHYE